MQTPITSRQNARVRELRASLAGRGAGDVGALEGWNLLREALDASRHGLTIQTVFLREDRAEFVPNIPGDIETVLLSHDAFASAAATQHSQGIAALFRRPKARYLPACGDLLLIAAGVQDPGNLGTLIRSAEAFGAAAVLLTEGTVDPWNSKALRASAGSVFRIPTVPWTETLRLELQTKNIRVLAAVPAESGAIPANQMDLRGGCAFVVGNEGSGISTELLSLADDRITLTMPGPTESLNAAVAGSLLLYEASRQRAQTPGDLRD